MSFSQRVFWISFTGATSIYLVMVFWTMPTISLAAGGLAPFDMRPFGYSPQEARGFLSALSAEGRDFYITVQQRLDLVYPALLGIMLIVGFQSLFPRRLSMVFSFVALIMVSADYLENYMVATMLHIGADGVEDSLVTIASFWTRCKSVAATVAFVGLVVGAVMQMRRRWA
ncbi:MAG: hypothetical protein GY767_10105 [Shimia sp.]|nr:hypothetical protein [Shimia sp.]MCP4823558.1 hypothetical protein [Shimia sp.]|mmetsp:Transcript_3107/g.3883  ORF Transcript_3107/g.3883 Transcript_3107/m.3883 type:complete len:171 (+) Transcript_3107:458-970(+)